MSQTFVGTSSLMLSMMPMPSPPANPGLPRFMFLTGSTGQQGQA